MDKIVTKFGNNPEFETYPGQVLFMMALDACNASVQRDVAGAQAKYDDLKLDSYPGEDVTELATEALRLIHILSGSYALPLDLGTKLIKKVTSTSSEFFNRKMFALLDKARTLETKYQLLDPASMGRDEEYTTYGPYVICATLQDEHGNSSQIPTGLLSQPSSQNQTQPQLYQTKESNRKFNVTNAFNLGTRRTILDVPYSTRSVLPTMILGQIRYRNHRVNRRQLVPKILGSI